jgi:periplasmic protein CpxP/Spy
MVPGFNAGRFRHSGRIFIQWHIRSTRRSSMNTRRQAVSLALGLTLALGASGTGVTLAQDMGGGMMGDESSMGMNYTGMRPGMGMMGHGKGMGPGMGMMGHGKDMGPGRAMMQDMQAMREMLAAEQQGELRDLMREHRPAQFERMGHATNLREDLMAELQKDRPDPDAVREIHGRMAEIHGEMMVERVRMRNAMYDLLTDEQRERLADKMPDDADSN